MNALLESLRSALESIRAHKVALKGRVWTPIQTGYASPDQRGLAAARDTGDAGEQPQGKAGPQVFEVVLSGADERKPLPVRRPPPTVGRGHLQVAAQVTPGQRVGIPGDGPRRAEPGFA